ncbi:Inositol-1-monophosphatase [Mycena indigotica]|uniref:Inositol-1-monophosphatase n=1 Tax=Mycena indigotica TaxID=2126181 RepID=A0A8H6SXF6_9AGAR|nr:Inositol-1-monophosphatase [Mycena indigotica]KAF7307144.1 Inositol-1-monophosphatase [Mycena indigotica]
MSTELDLESILDFTVALAKRAGDLILEGSLAIQSAPASSINEKKNAVDLVTEFDVRVEELVKSELGSKYPAFKFIGEESYSAGDRAPLTDDPTFCVDPIDGTTNFVHGFPYVCISLGLIVKKRPVLGVIYNPFLSQLYTGIKGHGSFLTTSDGKRLKLPLASSPKPLPSLSQALIAVEWGSDRAEKPISAKSSSFGRLAGDPSQVPGGKMAHSLRSVGSAALNFALVAQGALDLYWEVGCWPWDVCAGVVIAEEAGGIVTGSREVFAATRSEDSFGDVTEAILTGRKYIVVRAIGGAEGETTKQAQKRIIEEFYATVEDIQPN